MGSKKEGEASDGAIASQGRIRSWSLLTGAACARGLVLSGLLLLFSCVCGCVWVCMGVRVCVCVWV